MRAPKDDPEVGGDYYGLPRPCWGTPEFKYPGTPILYNTNLPVKEGGGTFRARFGVERVVKRKVMENGQEVEREDHDNLLAEGSYSVGSEIKDGYPEFTLGVLKKLGWDKDLTRQEMEIIQRVNSANPPRHDVSGLRRTMALADPILSGLGFGARACSTRR